MAANRRLTLLSCVVILTFVLSLVSPSRALADEPTPPPPETEAAPTEAPPAAASPVNDAPQEVLPANEASMETAPSDVPTEGAEVAETVALPEVLADAADTGVVIADVNGDPLVMGSTEAAETLAAGDPSFTIGTTTYNFTFADCDPGPDVTACENPIQAAIDYLTNNNLMPDDNTIYVAGSTTYTQSVVIGLAGLTLMGDPGDELVAGAAQDAPVLHGPGTDTDSVGVTITAEGVSLIGFIIENWGTAVLQDVVVGNSTTYIENNTIQNNNDGIKFISEERGKPGSEVHYNVFQGNLGFAIINAGTPGVGDNNIQDIDASNNYWGCDEGPVVKFKNPENNNDWDYIVWSEVYNHENSSDPPVYDNNPYPDCGMLYGRDSLFMHGGNNYKPYKIIINPIETTKEPWCGDGVLSAGEACDPTANPTGAPDHYICNEDCTTTYVPWCGDGIVNQPSEQCDGRAGVRDNQVCGADCRIPPPPPMGGLGILYGGIITAGRAHTCAITPEGGVQCWGNNDFGQLGNGKKSGSNVPVDVVDLYSGEEIVAGSDHTCLLSGGNVWCWGLNNKGQLGDGTTTNRNVPVRVLSGAARITTGADYTCAELTTGGVLCWGNNANGQLGDGTTTDHAVPTVASLIENVSSVDGGQRQTCALTASRAITCWSGGMIPVTGAVPEQNIQVSVSRFGDAMVGLNTHGTPVVISASGSAEISSLTGVLEVDSGTSHYCARMADGSVKCWGANKYGQLGNDSTADSSIPVEVSDLPGAADLGVGSNHACVIVTATLTDTLIECWGLNLNGQLGNGTTTNSSTPVEVLTDN